MWDLPGPGLEPMSPALAGGFLTTVPQGSPKPKDLNLQVKEQEENQKASIVALKRSFSTGHT